MKKHWWHPKTEFKKGHKPKWTKESREKARQSHLGRKSYVMTDEIKEKMSKSAKKIKEHSGRFKEGHKINNGREHTKEQRMETSERMKNKKRPEFSGSNNPNWKGGITSENMKERKSIEYRLWRESVFACDNWTCQKCGTKGGELCSHHIRNFADYPELRLAIDNGITFCKECHMEFHRRYGIKNNTREQIVEFLERTEMAGQIEEKGIY